MPRSNPAGRRKRVVSLWVSDEEWLRMKEAATLARTSLGALVVGEVLEARDRVLRSLVEAMEAQRAGDEIDAMVGEG
jgi:hypothetical protein